MGMRDERRAASSVSRVWCGSCPACGRVSGREMAERFVVIEYALGRELLLSVGDNELVAQQFGRAGRVFFGDDGRIDRPSLQPCREVGDRPTRVPCRDDAERVGVAQER